MNKFYKGQLVNYLHFSELFKIISFEHSEKHGQTIYLIEQVKGKKRYDVFENELRPFFTQTNDKILKPINIKKEQFSHMLKGQKVEYYYTDKNGQQQSIKIELDINVIKEVLQTQIDLEKNKNIKNYYRDLLQGGHRNKNMIY